MVKFTSVLSILEPVFQPYDDATFDHRDQMGKSRAEGGFAGFQEDESSLVG